MVTVKLEVNGRGSERAPRVRVLVAKSDDQSSIPRTWLLYVYTPKQAKKYKNNVKKIVKVEYLQLPRESN